MKTELVYLDDPLTLEFNAQVTGKVVLADGRKGIVLARTYFYPTGGGQEHDTGTLGDARVVDVLIDDAGDVVHVLDRELTESVVIGKIDRERRLAFMQHHSGQHLLSQVLEELFGYETVSSRISIDSPTTIDLRASEMRDADLTRAEDRANAIIREDRVIKSYYVSESEIHTVPFRRPPKVKGQIRVVEIEAFDYSACGGTHCTRTGMIGVVKILKSERRGEKIRLYFVAGERALGYFQKIHTIVTEAAHRLDTNPDALVDTLQRQQEMLGAAQKELESLQEERIEVEARRLVANAETLDSIKLVRVAFRNRSPQQVRALAARLQDEPSVVTLLAAYDGAKVTLTVTCAPDTHVDASALIRKQLAEIGGRGGGDARLAQGGGALDESRFEAFFANTRQYVKELRRTRASD